MRLQPCHKAVLECPASQELAASLPCTWLASLCRTSGTIQPHQHKLHHCQRGPHPCAPPGFSTHLKSTSTEPTMVPPGMQHNGSKGCPLKQNLFLLFTRLPEMLNCFIRGFLIGKEIKKYFVNLLLNLQQLLALKNERKSLVAVRAAQHHIALPLFTPPSQQD